MLFNSFHFLIFFPLVTLLYFLSDPRLRWALLLAASVYFYMAFIPVYILVLGAVIVVDYAVGLGLERLKGRAKKALLLASLCSNLGFLFMFKYFAFADANLARLASLLGWNYGLHTLSWALPLGLSFHTFQSMAYIIEVYRGKFPAERHLGIYALYVMFYPQLVAGPIERPHNLLPQLRERHMFDYDRVTSGLKLMAWGFFKKLFIADRLAAFVGQVYGAPQDYRGAAVLLGLYAFAVQIFCDFSGYTDIARGAAQVMGFRLMENFKRPYESRSIREFWRRWHISLSSWFRDYVYIPLGGSRTGALRLQLNLFVTFVLSGLWHGARWTFVVWGALHGIYALCSLWTRPIREKLSKTFKLERCQEPADILRAVFIFHLVVLAWVFFRATSLTEARAVLENLWPVRLWSPKAQAALPSLLIPGLSVLFMETVHAIERRRGSAGAWLAARPAYQRWAFYYAAASVFVFLSQTSAPQTFIYFQF